VIVTLKKPLIGYKIVFVDGPRGGIYRAVVTLKIPAGARVFSYEKPFKKHSKMRAERAEVLSIEMVFSYSKTKLRPIGEKDDVYSSYDRTFKYRVGQKVRPHVFDTLDIQCSAGIHFFIDFESAKKYC
jgi:hypothetical protein